jgi:hypothetical protein
VVSVGPVPSAHSQVAVGVLVDVIAAPQLNSSIRPGYVTIREERVCSRAFPPNSPYVRGSPSAVMSRRQPAPYGYSLRLIRFIRP